MHTITHVAATTILGETEAFKRKLREAVERDVLEREDIVRWLLGRWVSGLEPAIVVDAHTEQIIGLCDAQADPGSTPYILLI